MYTHIAVRVHEGWQRIAMVERQKDTHLHSSEDQKDGEQNARPIHVGRGDGKRGRPEKEQRCADQPTERDL